MVTEKIKVREKENLHSREVKRINNNLYKRVDRMVFFEFRILIAVQVFSEFGDLESPEYSHLRIVRISLLIFSGVLKKFKNLTFPAFS